jgi:hypothetical protein
VGALAGEPELVAKVDADVSFGPDYFELLCAAFARDPHLGMASGEAWHLERAEWRPRSGDMRHVEGQARIYRWDCLQDVLPLEERLGWDMIDQLTARQRGWSTRRFEIPFRHHRKVGERESPYTRWHRRGEKARYLGDSFVWVFGRAVYASVRSPAALPGLIAGYVSASRQGLPRHSDPRILATARREKRLRTSMRRIKGSLTRYVSGSRAD